jgi:hypothetical protein
MRRDSGSASSSPEMAFLLKYKKPLLLVGLTLALVWYLRGKLITVNG